MNAREAETVLVEELRRIAPDIDITVIDRDGDLREQFDIDSMDFLNLVTALNRRLGLPIPDADYPRLATFAGAIGYLAEQTHGT
jgi:acyl carrier protein